jgi:hypothetical protein
VTWPIRAAPRCSATRLSVGERIVRGRSSEDASGPDCEIARLVLAIDASEIRGFVRASIAGPFGDRGVRAQRSGEHAAVGTRTACLNGGRRGGFLDPIDHGFKEADRVGACLLDMPALPIIVACNTPFAAFQWRSTMLCANARV